VLVLWLALAFLAGLLIGLLVPGVIAGYRVERTLSWLERELRQMKERGEKPDVTEAEKAELWTEIRKLRPAGIERLRRAGLLEHLEPEAKKSAPK
jgi:hypothetical protein